MTGTANLSWQLSSNSILDIRAAVSRFNYPITDTPRSSRPTSIAYSDGYTSYSWGVNGNLGRATSTGRTSRARPD